MSILIEKARKIVMDDTILEINEALAEIEKQREELLKKREYILGESLMKGMADALTKTNFEIAEALNLLVAKVEMIIKKEIPPYPQKIEIAKPDWFKVPTVPDYSRFIETMNKEMKNLGEKMSKWQMELITFREEAKEAVKEFTKEYRTEGKAVGAMYSLPRRTITNDPRPFNSILSGRLTVTTAGTRVQFPSVACKSVTVMAMHANTDVVVVGGSDVVAAVSTRKGIPLLPATPATFAVNNLGVLYLDSVVNSEGVTYTYHPS